MFLRKTLFLYSTVEAYVIITSETCATVIKKELIHSLYQI